MSEPAERSETEAVAPSGGRSRSLVRRLILLAAGWSLAVLVLVGTALTAFFTQASVNRFQVGVADLAETLYSGASVAPSGEIVPPALNDPRALRAQSGRYWQISEPAASGDLVARARSRSLWDASLPGPPGGVERLRAAPTETVFYDADGPAGQRLRVAAQYGRLGDRELVFLAGEDRSPIDADARIFALLTLVALVLMAAGLIAAVVVQVRVGLKPLFDLGAEIAEVRKGRVQRLSGDYPREIKPLSDELNALLDYNQEVVERQRTHVGNLAHALKTPLSVMLTEARQKGGPLSEVVERQSELMRAQVDHHLRRARAAARAQTAGERTAVEPVLDELAVMLERVFQDKGVEIDWRAPEDLCFRGERQDLQEIVGNLIENACKFGRSRVRVTAEPGPLEGRLTIVVDDDGPGLPADRRQEVLKRGARLDESAPGSGLGLSIVDELARAYGGQVSLSDSPWGGLRATLVLPAAD